MNKLIALTLNAMFVHSFVSGMVCIETKTEPTKKNNTLEELFLALPEVTDHKITYLAANLLINRIYAIATQYKPQNKRGIELCKRITLSPQERQTSKGLFLEVNENGTASLWSPWGKWKFISAMNILDHADKDFWNEIRADEKFLTLKQYAKQTCEFTKRTLSNLYKIVKVNDISVPEACEPLEQNTNYRLLFDQWNFLNAQWDQANKLKEAQDKENQEKKS